MNLVKYIIVNGLSESDLTEICQELANLYANTGFTKEVKIFRNKIDVNEFILNFSEETDFERFKYFVNYLSFCFEHDSNHRVYGYWTISHEDEINKELYGKRVQLYVSDNDEDGDNVYGIPENWNESIKLGFAIGEEYVPIGKKEFEFFENKQTKSGFYSLRSIYGIVNDNKSKNTGCLLLLLTTILFGFLISFIIFGLWQQELITLIKV